MSALGITEADTELHPVKAWLETSVPPAPSTETPLGEDTQADGQKAAQHGAPAADPLAGEPSSPAFDPRPQPGSPDRVSGIGRDPATHPLTPKSPPLQGPRSIMASLPSNRPESYYGEPPPRPEETIVELPPFHTIGVMALIINKMIGVGIFVTPPLVLMLTGSRWVSFWLWVAGGIYAIFGSCFYIEYANHLPFDGGDLIYVDKVFYSNGWMVRERHIFPPILFSIFWLATSSPVTSTYFTSTNVLLAIQPTASGPQDLNIWTIILLAVGWIGLVCFITYSSRPITMILNVAFALYKVVLLLVLLVAGMKAGGANRNNSSGGWNELVPQGSITTTASSLSALMLVIYSYSGFQNANYVGSEIWMLGQNDGDRRLIRWASLPAVVLVTVLYVFLSTAYALALPTSLLSQDSWRFIASFASVAFGGSARGIRVALAVSALGNLFASAYTVAKVNQQIGRQNLFPGLCPLLRRTDAAKRSRGGLAAVFIITSLVIVCVTVAGQNSWLFYGVLFAYGQLFWGAWIGFGLSALRNYMKILPANSSFTPTAWDPLLFRYTAAIIPISLVFAFASLFLFFVAPFSPIQALGDTDHHLYPIIAASIFGAAVIWYNFMRYLLRRQEKEVAEQKKGAEEKQTARSAQRPEDVPAPLPLGIAIDNGSDSGAEEDIPAYSKHAIGIRLVNEFNVDMKDYDEHTALDATQFHGNPRAIGWIIPRDRWLGHTYAMVVESARYVAEKLQ